MGAVSGDNSLFFSTGLDNSGLLKGSAEAGGIVQNMASKISKINPFAALGVAAVAAFAMIASSATKMAKEFEHAMKEVETISAATQKNFKGISSQVFALSKITPDNPEKLAKAYYQIVSAGYDGAAGLKLLETAAKAAVGGVTDTQTAADGLTTVLNAFKIEAGEVNSVADVMFQTVKLGKTTFGELAANMSTVAPIAAASGISFDQISAAIATLTKQGVPTAQAMTQIRSAIIGANESLGDGWVKAMSLQDAFQLLYDKAGGSQTALQELVGRVEAVGGVLGVAGKNAKMAAEDLASIKAAAGANEQAYASMVTSNVSQSELLRNKIKATTEGIGNFFNDMSTNAISDLAAIFEENDKLSKKYTEQKIAINDLYTEYLSLHTEESRRLEILEEINKLNPSIIEGLKNEAIGYDNLGESIRKYNAYVLSKEIVSEDFGDRIAGQEKLIKHYKKEQKETEGDLKREYQEFVLSLSAMKISDTERAGLQAIISSEGDFMDKIEPIRAKISEIMAKGYEDTSGITSLPFGDIKDYESLAGAVELVEKSYNKLQAAAKEALINYQDNTTDAPFVVNEIENVNSLIELEKNYSSYQNKTIKEAYKNRVEQINNQNKIAAEIAKINGITKQEYDKNSKVLAAYLKSEDKQIREAAEKREKYFNYKIAPPKTDTTFKEELTEKKKQYDGYKLAIENKDLELAKKLKETYKLKEEDYTTYLRNLYAQTEDYNKKSTILETLDKSDSGLVDRKKATPIVAKLMPVTIIPEIDTTSVEAINTKLKKLRSDWSKAQTKLDRETIQKQIEVEEAKLKSIELSKGKKEKIEEDFYKTIQSLSRKGLLDKKKELKKELKAVKDSLGEQSEAYKKLRDQIDKINEETGKGVAGVAAEFSKGFSGLSDLFAKFGDEDTAQVLGQLSGVADGIASIASGDIIGGSLAVLNSAITVTVESDTEQFEKDMERLSRVIKNLALEIDHAMGTDRIDKRLENLKQEAALLEANKKALQAELEARRSINVLGISVRKKGEGSGSDAEKIKEFEDSIQEAIWRLKDLQTEIYETLTAATKNSIADSIIEGFKAGKNSIADFAGTFEELMKKAMIETFKLKFLEVATNKFFEQFGQMAESGQSLSPVEIANLRASFNDLLTKSQAEMEALNEILSSAGIAGGMFGETAENRGLSGAIRENITEETGTELAGLMRRIAEDVRAGLFYGKTAVENLVLIEANTKNTVKELQFAVVELKSIAKNTREIYLHDIGA